MGQNFHRIFADESEDSLAYRITHGFARIFGRWPMARARYAQAIARDSANQDYLINHVDLLVKLGRKQEAYADLDRLLKLGVAPGQLRDFYIRLRTKKK